MEFTYNESTFHEDVTTFSLVKNHEYTNPSSVYRPISDGSYSYCALCLKVKLTDYEIREVYRWEIFPYKSGAEPRQRTSFELYGRGEICTKTSVCILEDDFFFTNLYVRLYADPACVRARTNLVIIDDSPELAIWIPTEGFNQLIEKLKYLADPTMHITSALNLSHVYISDSDFQRCVVEDEAEGMTLNLFRYPKQISNYDEIPNFFREMHIDKRHSKDAEINISFANHYRKDL